MSKESKQNNAFSLPELLNKFDQLSNEVEKLKSKHFNRQKLNTLFNEAPLPLVCLSDGCKVFFANQQFLETVGLQKDSIENKNFCSLLNNDEEKENLQKKLNLLYEGGSFSLDEKLTLRTKHRGRVLFRLRARLVEYEDDIEKAIHIILQDISEEANFREAYRNLVENSFQAILIAQDFRIVFANEVAAEISGYSIEELKNLDINGVKKLVHPEDRDKLFELMRQRFKGKRISPKQEFKGIRKDGSTYWLEVLVSYMEYNGRPALQIVQIDISEKKKAETQASSVEHKYLTLVEQSIIGVYIVTDGRFTYVNPRLASIFGYNTDEIINKMTPKDLVHPDDQIKVEENLRKRISGEIDSLHYEFKGVTKKGRQIYVEVHGSRTVLDGQPSVIGMLQDVTERKETEEKLNLQSSALNSAANGIVITDKTGSIVYINPAFTKLTGYSFSDVVGKDPNILKSGKHDKAFYSNIWRTILSGEVWQGEIINKKKDGTEYIENQTITPVLDENSEIDYFIAIKSDVTERRKTETALKESEEKLRNVIEHSNEIYYIHDCNQVLTYVSPQSEDMLGYSPEEALMNWTELVTDNPINQKGFKLTQKAIETGERQEEYILELKRKDGKKIFVEVFESPLKNSEGEVIGIAGALRNVTEKLFAEKKLKESEERFRGMYENAILGIYRTSPEGEVLMANPALFEMLGYNNFEEFSTLCGPLYDDPSTKDRFRQLIAEKGELYGFETVARRKDGTKLHVRESARMVKSDDGEIQYYEGIVEDISSQKEAEQKLIEAKEAAEKSDLLKTDFLAQMSHEIRTPINVIQSFSGLIKDEVRGLISNELLNSFSIIDNASRRMIRTIDLILNMSQLQTDSYQLSKAELDLYQEILINLYPELSRLAKEKSLILNINKPEGLPKVYVDEYSARQIFDNLIHNAIKYTAKGRVDVSMFNNDNDSLIVEVEDTGIGISEEYLPNLFKPFTQEEHGYTRKFEGNGLGLALVKRYCELNAIDIKIESKKNVGTKFILSFPISNKKEN